MRCGEELKCGRGGRLRPCAALRPEWAPLLPHAANSGVRIFTTKTGTCFRHCREFIGGSYFHVENANTGKRFRFVRPSENAQTPVLSRRSGRRAGLFDNVKFEPAARSFSTPAQRCGL